MRTLLLACLAACLTMATAPAAAAEQIAVNPSGDAHAEGCLGASFSNVRVVYCGPTAVSVAGDANSTDYDHSQCRISAGSSGHYVGGCGSALAFTVLGTAEGGYAISVLGEADGLYYAVSGTGDAEAAYVAASGTGDASSEWAATAFGDAEGHVACDSTGLWCISQAVSVFGNSTSTAQCNGSGMCQSIAVSGFGHASSGGITLSACDLAAAFGYDQLCLYG